METFDKDLHIRVKKLKELGFTVDDNLPDNAFVKRSDVQFCGSGARLQEGAKWASIGVVRNELQLIWKIPSAVVQPTREAP